MHKGTCKQSQGPAREKCRPDLGQGLGPFRVCGLGFTVDRVQGLGFTKLYCGAVQWGIRAWVGTGVDRGCGVGI